MRLGPRIATTPFVNIFGSAGSPWQYLRAEWRKNGTGPAISGAAWRGVVDLVGERPRSGKLSDHYVTGLGDLLLKAGSRRPSLVDAAIWLHRADDLEARFGAIRDSASLETELRKSLVNQLGLTDEEIAVMFDCDAHPLADLSLDEVLQDTIADPQEYLPDLDRTGSDLAGMVSTFETLANSRAVGLVVRRPLLLRIAASLAAKRFLILSGLAGSGKTKIAQAVARWLAPAAEDGQLAAYAVIPVGADWTGNDNILGYPDGLDPTRYVTRPTLDLIQRAAEPENALVPHFLILDEMNLSHVERYFADLLSLIESGEPTELYRSVVGDDGTAQLRSGVEPTLQLPPNLFVIGTVNVDETTYMFSPKVLDRANVIEFRMEREELAGFLTSPRTPDMDKLNGRGSGFGSAFVAAAAESVSVPEAVRELFETEMLLFFDLLHDHQAEFGFRVSNEAARFLYFCRLLGGHAADSTDWFAAAMDAVIVQKFLPKLHGSRPKLEGLLWALTWACGADRAGLGPAAFLAQCRQAGRAQEETKYGPEKVEHGLGSQAARYPLSFDKVLRMWRKLVRDQFVTFAEA